MKNKLDYSISIVLISLAFYFVFVKARKTEKIKAENKELLTENVRLLKELERLESAEQPEVEKDVFVLRNFHCDYSDCKMNDKFIIDTKTNTICFWDQEKQKEVTIQFSSTAKAIEYYANYMTILAY